MPRHQFARLHRHGYINHICLTAVYFCGIYSSTKAAKMTGLHSESILKLKKEFPEAYTMGLAEKARRQQSAKPTLARRAPANKTPDF